MEDPRPFDFPQPNVKCLIGAKVMVLPLLLLSAKLPDGFFGP